MEKFSNALFDMIGKIVGAAIQSDTDYPLRLIGRLKARFGKLLGYVDSLLDSASSEA